MNLSILRNTRFSLSPSSRIEANTGCATCAIVPEMNPLALLFHLFAWVKLPTTCGLKRCPKMKLKMFWLTVLTIVVMRIL